MTRLQDENQSIFQQLPTFMSTWKLNPVREGADVQPMFLSEGTHLLGSGSDCDFVVSVSGIAEHHCRLVVQKGLLTVQAVDPHTWLNDGVVQKSRVRSGDRLTVGPVTFLLFDQHDEKFGESREWSRDPDVPLRSEASAGWLQKVARRESERSGVVDLNPAASPAGESVQREELLDELQHSLKKTQSQLIDQKEQLQQLMAEKNKMVEQAEQKLAAVEPWLSSVASPVVSNDSQKTSGTVSSTSAVNATQGLFTAAAQQGKPDPSVYYRNQLERLLQVQKKWRQQFLKKQSELGLAESRLKEKSESLRQQEQSFFKLQEDLRQQQQALSLKQQELDRNQLALVASQQDWDARERSWEVKYEDVCLKIQAADLMLEEGRTVELELQDKLASLYEQLSEQSLRVQELELLEPELSILKEENSAQANELVELREELQTEKSGLQEREELLRQSQQDLEKLAKEKLQLEQVISQQEKQLAQVQESLTVSQQELDSVKSQAVELQQELTSVREEMSRFREETQHELVEAAGLKEELQGQILENQILLDEKELAKNALEENLNALQQQLIEAKDELSVWQARVAEEEQQKENLKAESEQLQTEILAVRQETAGQLEESLQQMSTRELELQVSREQFEFQMAEAEALQGERDSLQELLSSQEQQLAHLETELVNLREQSAVEQSGQQQLRQELQTANLQLVELQKQLTEKALAEKEQVEQAQVAALADLNQTDRDQAVREEQARELEQKEQAVLLREEKLRQLQQQLEQDREALETRFEELELSRNEIREKEEELAAEEIRLRLREEKIFEQDDARQVELPSQNGETDSESLELTQEFDESELNPETVVIHEQQQDGISLDEELQFSLVDDFAESGLEESLEGQQEAAEERLELVLSDEADSLGISLNEDEGILERLEESGVEREQASLEEDVLQETRDLLGDLEQFFHGDEGSIEEAPLDEASVELQGESALFLTDEQKETGFDNDADPRFSSEQNQARELETLTEELPEESSGENAEESSTDELARIRKELANMFGLAERGGSAAEEPEENAEEDPVDVERQTSLFRSLEETGVSGVNWENEQEESELEERAVAQPNGLKSLLSAELWGEDAEEGESENSPLISVGANSAPVMKKGSAESEVVVDDIEDAESVAAYMERLFARTGGRQSASPPPPSPPVTHAFSGMNAAIAVTGGQVSETGAAAGKVLPANVSQVEFRETLRPISQHDRDLIKKEIESLRDVANQTARNALATHAWKQVRLKMMASGLLTLVSGLTAAVLISSPWWSPISYENYGWLTLLLTLLSAGELFRSRLQLIQLKQNRKSSAGSGSVENESLEDEVKTEESNSL